MAMLAIAAVALTAPISTPFAVAILAAGAYVSNKVAPLIGSARIEGDDDEGTVEKAAGREQHEPGE